MQEGATVATPLRVSSGSAQGPVGGACVFSVDTTCRFVTVSSGEHSTAVACGGRVLLLFRQAPLVPFGGLDGAARNAEDCSIKDSSFCGDRELPPLLLQ